MQQYDTELEKAPAAPTPRQRIVAGARSHFFSRGLRGVTMDDLAEELGMSKKTLYAHFRSKKAVLKAAMLDKFREVEGELERITSPAGGDFAGVLHDLLATIQRQTGEIQPAFIHDVQREAPELFQLVEARRQVLIRRHFGRLLAAGRKAGFIRKDIAPRLVMEIFLGAVHSVVNPAKLIELGLTPKTCISTIITVFLEGIVTGEGRLKP
jgi:AcrR family transcriptional regulator